MKCPHCQIDFHDLWETKAIMYNSSILHLNIRNPTAGLWHYKTCYCSSCGGSIIKICLSDIQGRDVWSKIVQPQSAARGKDVSDVPENLVADYKEACDVVSISAKASAALSRRCLQNILNANGYTGRDLSKQIDAVLNEMDPKKAIPPKLRDTIDSVRNFGNFSAHPITDLTTLQIVDVEPEEAEWCLEIIEECFEHFYINPTIVKRRKAALDAKLAAAGKPLSKS